MTEASGKKRNGFFGGVLRVAHRIVFAVGLAVILSVVMTGMMISRMSADKAPPLPEKIYLTYIFGATLEETVTSPDFSQPLLLPQTTFHDVIAAMDAAVHDARVQAFVAKIENPAFSAAQVQELRAAVARLRAAGKETYVYGDNLGGFAGGMGAYYLASSFGHIWLQPVGNVAVNGVSAEVPFVAGVLEKIGVEAQFVHRGKYKSAPESLTEKSMSPPHREMMGDIVSDLSAQMLADIAADRKIAPEKIRALVAGSPYDDQGALAASLVDRVGYLDEIIATVEASGLEPVGLRAYHAATGNKRGGLGREVSDMLRKKIAAQEKTAKKQDAPPAAQDVQDAPAEPAPKAPLQQGRIAVIVGSGEIVPVSGSPGFSGGGMEAEKIAAAFREAREDDSIKAVVFRVDSPGGAPSAAETIRRAVILTQQAGKPVVVSMGSYAASGGYWIAAPADKIVAQPATLTGSIGVFGGKFVFAELLAKIGMRFDAVSDGLSQPGMWSATRKFTEDEVKRFDALMGGVYDAFIARVVEGRKMPPAAVEAVAQGRVFTGRQAHEKGLVDALGGMETATAIARELAGFAPDADVQTVMLPAPLSPLEIFLSMTTEGVTAYPAVLSMDPARWLKLLARGNAPESGMLRLPPAVIE